MKEGNATASTQDLARAQRLRLNRVLAGCVPYAFTAILVACCWFFGYLEGWRAVHFLVAVTAINGTAITMVLTGANLRLKDPSMTGPLIVAALWPSIYVMFHLEEPMLRTPFLLMATVAVLFGALAFDLRRMLGLGATVLTSYLVMLVALAVFAPERLNWRVEAVMIFAYTASLVHIAFISSFITGLRNRLREKNVFLEELATRDPLTRLPNRRTAMQQLERELSHSERRRRDGDGLCIGLLDVDHFKRVNDQFGHQAGDAVLRLLGDTLSRAMRQGDFVARFGGEEFLIILPETSMARGELAVERMRRAVAEIPPETLPAGLPITVSIGLAAHDDGRRVEETLGYADQALYHAKHLGRNRVAVWQEQAVELGAAG